MIEFMKSQFVVLVLLLLIILSGVLVLHTMHDPADSGVSIAWAEKVTDGFIAALLLALNMRTNAVNRKEDSKPPTNLPPTPGMVP